jgi:amino acid transporter
MGRVAPQPPKTGGEVLLRRNYLSAIENVAQSIGTMGPVATIGTILPLLIYKSGNGTWLLFLGVLAAFWLIAASINVFASRFASAGSLSAFAQHGFGGGLGGGLGNGGSGNAGLGDWAGRLTGWSYVVALIFVATSSGVSSAYYFAIVLTHFSGWAVGAAGFITLTILVALMAWWPAHHDVKLSTNVMLGAESFSLLLILVILFSAMMRSHHWVDRAQLHLEGTGFSHYQLAFVLAFMTLAGFESATALGEEAKTATHTLPRVMILCVLPIGLLFAASIYCMTTLSHSLNLALDQTDGPLDMIARSVGLPTLGWLSSLGVAISCFGCSLGGFNAGSRVVYSMARNGQLWRWFDAIHPVNGTPHRALTLFAGISIVVPSVTIAVGVSMANAMDYLMQIAALGFLGGYLVVCVAAPVYLASKGELRFPRLAAAILTLSILVAVLVMSLVPIPEGPSRYLPYIFAALLIFGMLLSGRNWGRGPKGIPAVDTAANSAAQLSDAQP